MSPLTILWEIQLRGTKSCTLLLIIGKAHQTAQNVLRLSPWPWYTIALGRSRRIQGMQQYPSTVSGECSPNLHYLQLTYIAFICAFVGSAVYVYCIIADYAEMAFLIDDLFVGTFTFSPSTELYNYPVYTNGELPMGYHTLIIMNGVNETSSGAVLDYIVYT